MIEMKTLTMDGKTHEIVDAKARKDIRTTRAPSIIQTVEGTVVAAKDSANDPIVGLKLFGKTTRDTTTEPTPDNPKELVNINPTVSVFGKNLIDESKLVYHPEYTDLYSSALSVTDYYMKNGTTYTISFDTENTGVLMYLNPNSGFTYQQFTMDGKRHSFTATMKNTINHSGTTLALVSLSETTDVSCGMISNVQVELGNVATDYEPYKAAQTISVNYGIPGVPVSQNGNYTDDNGQQWICDEIDFGRGVHVHRVKVVELDGSEPWSTQTIPVENCLGIYLTKPDWGVPVGQFALMCSHFKVALSGTNGKSLNTCAYNGGLENFLINVDTTVCGSTLTEIKQWLKAQYDAGNPVTVYIALANPYETVLSDEDLETFAEFCSNYPSTTIYNDFDAWMEVSYSADTKNFIKNYIAEAISQEVTS